MYASKKVIENGVGMISSCSQGKKKNYFKKKKKKRGIDVCAFLAQCGIDKYLTNIMTGGTEVLSVNWYQAMNKE